MPKSKAKAKPKGKAKPNRKAMPKAGARADAVWDEAVEAFAMGQDLAGGPKHKQALECFTHAERLIGPQEPFEDGAGRQAPRPPLALVLSAVRNGLGEWHMDRAMRACRQRSLTGADADAARRSLEGALEVWPGNAPAAVSLANLHRDGGDLEAALGLYAQVAPGPPTLGAHPSGPRCPTHLP